MVTRKDNDNPQDGRTYNASDDLKGYSRMPLSQQQAALDAVANGLADDLIPSINPTLGGIMALRDGPNMIGSCIIETKERHSGGFTVTCVSHTGDRAQVTRRVKPPPVNQK